MDDALPVVTGPTLQQDVVKTAQSILRIVAFVLQLTYSISTSVVAFVTLTLPRIAFSILHWGATFTLKLDFPRLFVTLVIGGTTLSYIWKVRYLNRSA